MNCALEDYRRFFAEEIGAVAAVRSQRLVDALAKVPRENFLGPGPWKIAAPDFGMGGGTRYRETVDADPRRLYHNVLIAIDPARQLNNGHPSTLAAWIDMLDLAPRDRVFHLGAGVGYYTALMAEMAGHVTGAEVDPALAERARENLRPWNNVEILAGDGAAVDPGPVDAIFINAGVTHPRALWLDRLNDGGRLLFPLTFDTGGGVGKGVTILVKRQGDRYPARVGTFVMIYSCTSLRDPDLNSAIMKQVSSMKLMQIQSLRRDRHEPADTCLLHGPDFCLQKRDGTL